jgi:hypothetical protein
VGDPLGQAAPRNRCDTAGASDVRLAERRGPKHAPSLAPGAGAKEVDVRASVNGRQTPDQPGGQGPHISDGKGQPPGGGASGSGASSPSSASGSRQRRSVRCCGGPASARLLAVVAPPGASSLGPRLRGFWRLTSSLSKRSCSGRCTCCSRSRSHRAVFTSWASPGTPTPHGSPSRPATWQRGGRGLQGVRFLIRDRDSKLSGPSMRSSGQKE